MKLAYLFAPIAFAFGLLSLAPPAVADDAATQAAPVATNPVATNLAGSANPFTLIAPTTPEYQALQRLVADGLVHKHAGLLKDGRPLTRYEAAIVAAEAINNARTLMRDGKSAQVTADDVAALRIVYDDVKDNLTALTARINADETRIAALETDRATQVAQNIAPSPEPTTFKPSFELHGEFRIRPINTQSQSGSAEFTNLTPVPPGTNVIRTGTIGDATVTTGLEGFGEMQSRMRLVGDGHISPNADFIVRLSTEDLSGANNPSLVHNDFSFAQYAVPNTPYTVYGGKLLLCCGTPWLPDGTGLIADAVPIGMAVKYTQPSPDPHQISGWLAFASLKNANTPVLAPPFNVPACNNESQNLFGAHGEAAVAPTWKIQGQLLVLPGQCVSAVPSGDGLLINTATMTLGSLTITHQFTPLLSGTLELLSRWGNDPATKSGWNDNGAWYLGFNYGKYGTSFNSAFDATYIDTGKNSIPGNLDSIINGVDSPWNFQLPYPNNVQTFDLGYNWFYGPDVGVRFEWATANLRMNEAGLIPGALGLPPFTPVIITGDHHSLLILTGTFNF